MSGDVDVRLHGARELARDSARLAEQVEHAAPAAFMGVAEQQAQVVRVRVPRRSGALAGSVSAEHDDDGARVGIGDGLPYAGYIEFGGSHGRPYVSSGRYLYPTALDAEPQLAAAGRVAAETEIRRFRWTSPPV